MSTTDVLALLAGPLLLVVAVALAWGWHVVRRHRHPRRESLRARVTLQAIERQLRQEDALLVQMLEEFTLHPTPHRSAADGAERRRR